ncbi:MAG: hypothetical protein IIT36_05235, partial [Aeriscardovia sp.]|nr:hypothetical protein [Aeriscardovia sp.]
IQMDKKTHRNQIRETKTGAQPRHHKETRNTNRRLLKNRGDITMSTLLAAARRYKHECATKPGFNSTFQLGAIRFFESGAWESHVTLKKQVLTEQEITRQLIRLRITDQLPNYQPWRRLFLQECSQHASDSYDINAKRALEHALALKEQQTHAHKQNIILNANY